jgi:hypothetical protein
MEHLQSFRRSGIMFTVAVFLEMKDSVDCINEV